MDPDDFEPLDANPVVNGLHNLAEALRQHIPDLTPDGPSATAETALVYDDGFRVQMTTTVRLVVETKGSA